VLQSGVPECRLFGYTRDLPSMPPRELQDISWPKSDAFVPLERSDRGQYYGYYHEAIERERERRKRELPESMRVEARDIPMLLWINIVQCIVQETCNEITKCVYLYIYVKVKLLSMLKCVNIYIIIWCDLLYHIKMFKIKLYFMFLSILCTFWESLTHIRPTLGACGIWAGRVFDRAPPAVTQGGYKSK
jgi:hypothetical protein